MRISQELNLLIKNKNTDREANKLTMTQLSFGYGNMSGPPLNGDVSKYTEKVNEIGSHSVSAVGIRQFGGFRLEASLSFHVKRIGKIEILKLSTLAANTTAVTPPR